MKSKSTKRALGSMALAFESFVVFFATLTAFGLKVAAPELVWSIGLTLAFTMILTPAFLGRAGSYAFGWALQVIVFFLSIATIFVSTAGYFFLIGSMIFIGLWGWGMIAGGTIDKARKVYLESLEGENNE